MAMSELPTPSPLVRFPNFMELGDLSSFSMVIQDLSVTYDVTAVAVLPGYEKVLMPTTRIGPRRYSLLWDVDRLRVKSVSLGSPLEIIFYVLPLSMAAGIAAQRIAYAAKTWLDVLAAGADIRQRRQALEENRALAPERLREAQLRNALLEQQLRRVTVESDLLERACAEILASMDSVPEASSSSAERYRRSAGSLTSDDFAQLLDEPIRRLLAYGGGELEVAGDEGAGEDAGPG